MERKASPQAPVQPMDLAFRSALHPQLPVEVLERAELHRRSASQDLARRQRLQFHAVVLCYEGEGVHYVDFEPVEMRPGSLLHIHPGQVQEYRFDPDFRAHMVVYRPDLHRTFIPGQHWFPGSDVPTQWDLPRGSLDLAHNSIEELRTEQGLFDGSPAYIVLLEGLLTSFLARIHLLTATPASVSQLPEPYIRFRQYLEEHLQTRPTVTSCAAELGYSTRTLDRACQAAVGQTAKDVLGERISLEIRRLLTHTDIPITRVGTMFGFTEASSFSKFVQRHFGASPSDVRRDDQLGR